LALLEAKNGERRRKDDENKKSFLNCK